MALADPAKALVRANQPMKRNSPVNILVLIVARLDIGQVMHHALSLVKAFSRKAMGKVSRQLLQLPGTSKSHIYICIMHIMEKTNLKICIYI